MNISEKGMEFIKSHEGCKLESYQDGGGVWTIGYGHTKGVCAGQVITGDEADELLLEDVLPAEKCVNNSLMDGATQEQFDALVSFAFNLGCSALRNSTLLRKFNSGDDAGAAKEFLRWNHDNGKVVAGLTKRRQEEMEMFLA